MEGRKMNSSLAQVLNHILDQTFILRRSFMVSKKAILLWLFFLGIGMAQTTLCEAACTLPPTITVQPADVAVEFGGDASFTVTADAGGEPLTYQWQKDGAPLSDGGRISNATTSSLSITGVIGTDGGDYTCTVTCDDGGTGLSTPSAPPATLTVQMQLEVTVDGDGAADLNSSIVSAPAGIDCGGTVNDCVELYPYNTPVTLTAIPDPRATISWGGACSGTTTTCDLTMDQVHSATATFTLQTGTLDGTVTDTNGDPVNGVKIILDDGLDWTSPDPTTTTNIGGTYSFPDIYMGTYTVTAIKFMYKITPVTGVVVNEGQTTTQDFQLEDATMYTLSGIVTDMEVGWPLYAEIDWKYLSDDANFVGTGRTDPVTGEYSIELPEGRYAVTASAQGYETKSAPPMDLTTADATWDFELVYDDTTCTALGYKWAGIALSEDFNSCGIPQDWTVKTADGQTGDCDWVIADPDPGLTGNNTGGTGCFADADGNACGLGNEMHTELLTPVLDFSPLGDTVHLRFKTNFETVNSSKPGSIRVDIYTDSTGTWTGPDAGDPDSLGTSVFYHRTNLQGSNTQEFDITSWAAYETYVQIRFTFNFDGLDNPSWVQIDDVDVFNPTCVPPTTGGIVVGNVYDENTGLGLNGALVDNGGVNNEPFENSVFTVATPVALDDGFYSMYLENSGPVSLTATLDKYGPAIENPTVPLLDRVRQDFNLPAGQLSADPSAFEVHIAPDTILTLPMSILNGGGASGNFDIFERYYPAPPAPGVNQETPLGPPLVKSAYAVDTADTQDDSLVVFPEVGTPGTMDVIATNASTDYASGDFIGGDYSKMYVLDNQNSRLVTISTADGTVTEIGTSGTVAGEIWAGLTSDDINTILYASSSSSACDGTSTSTLYTINPADGTATTIGTIINAFCIMDIAIDSAGNLYGVDTYTDYLVQIDTATGVGTSVGASGLGIDASLGQGLDFDSSDTLYWASYNEITGGEGELRTIDVDTTTPSPTVGESTLIDTFPAGTHIDCLAFTADYLGEIPWLTEDPTSGTVDPGFFQEISLEFDSNGYTEGTTETGFLSVATITPYGTFNVPVVMVVEPAQQLTIANQFYGGAAGNVVADIGSINCGVDCTDSYPYGTELTLTATATTGSFLGWAGGCTGTDPVCTITMNQPQNVTAIFYDPTSYPGLQVLGVGIAGSGTGSVASTSTPSGSPTDISCGEGATDCLTGFIDGTSVTLNVTEGANSIFMGWSGDCTGNNLSCTVTLDQVRYVSATFTDTSGATNELSVALPGNGSGKVSSSPVGIFCGTAGNTCTAPFDDVATVTLTATPATGTTFTGWTGDCSGSNPICTATMNQARSVSAIFTLNSFDLTVTKDGLGDGTVTSNPAGIDCGSDCTESYDYGSKVVLTAVADTQSALTGWQGSCQEPVTVPPSHTCTVDIYQAEEVTVSFGPLLFDLTVTKDGLGDGTVTSNPAGIDCGSDCTEAYGYGSQIVLTAEADTESALTGWQGSCQEPVTVPPSHTCTVDIYQAEEITVSFEPLFPWHMFIPAITGMGKE
jgi:Immunoglobulin domain/Carboxypeptidase regulatory-like domain/Divergent InlB B-repeat domain